MTSPIAAAGIAVVGAYIVVKGDMDPLKAIAVATGIMALTVQIPGLPKDIAGAISGVDNASLSEYLREPINFALASLVDDMSKRT